MLGRIPAARQAIIDQVAAAARRARRTRLPVAPERFARYFFHGVSELDLVQRPPADLAGAALAEFELGRVRARAAARWCACSTRIRRATDFASLAYRDHGGHRRHAVPRRLA